MADVDRQEKVDAAIGQMLERSITSLRRVVKVLGTTLAVAVLALGLNFRTATRAKHNSDTANRIACASRNTFYYLFGIADPSQQSEYQREVTAAYKVYIDSQFKVDDCK